MSVRVSDIISVMQQFAPAELSALWDNSGLLLGRRDKKAEKIVIALDATNSVIAKAIEIDADMIITHHPLVFDSIKQINDESLVGRKLLTLAENRIALYAAHTNLDACDGGINDVFAELLELSETKKAFFEANVSGGESSFGIIGNSDKNMKLSEFAAFVKEKLSDEATTYSGDPDRIVKKVGLCCGAAGKMAAEALKESCDVFVTSETKLSDALFIADSGMCLVTAGHHQSERIILNKLKAIIETELSEISVIISGADFIPYTSV